MDSRPKHPGRRPAHLSQVGGKSPRQRIWEAIRNRRDGFGYEDLCIDCRIEDRSIRTYVYSLQRGGFVEPLGERSSTREASRFRLVRDNGLEAPRLTRDGKPVAQGRGNESMWQAMRLIGPFCARELAAYASASGAAVSEGTAASYISALLKAGYLVVVEPSRAAGKHGRLQARYALPGSKYTGPRPPMIQRTKSVYDPNLGEVVWRQEVNHDDL
ncbi:hypothetical protein [Laribacter hongkongensis]|uniref:hypothetical protein n=1 Tax=Laribacter hongkongensis TaxID=168471 RepID=UPI001EFDC702|nr:hypothetical protein [Laribacter hongkongensis]MCG9086855.1 hypothetical protein [Laribacter hongkongensis]